MKLLNECVLCGSSDLAPYAMRYSHGSPHLSRTTCKSCSAVFANPMAEEHELLAFYQNYYDKGNFQLFKYKDIHNEKFERYKTLSEDALKKEFNYTLKYKTGGNFLDIGFGLGDPLYLAHLHGFNVFGTEYDTDAIGFISGYIPEGTWHQGNVMEAPFANNSFDFIRFWHVIEHVINPHDYLKNIHRVLKPGGILLIGTPNIACRGYLLYRLLKFLSFSIPGIVDGMEHTILFSKATLAKTVEQAGFEIVEHYSHSNIETYTKLFAEPIPLWKKFVRVLQSLFHVNQALYARKKG